MGPEVESETDSGDEVEKAWKIGCQELIPNKSGARHEKAYKSFKIWITDQKVIHQRKKPVDLFCSSVHDIEVPRKFMARVFDAKNHH